jgi:ABC-type Fe3+ transport system substrate-binding protein
VALVVGGPHPQPARRLIDFLTCEQAERLLARSDSRNIPVRQSLRQELGLAPPPETKLGFDRIADEFDKAIALASQYLVR